MDDWSGPIADPAINRRFQQAVMEQGGVFNATNVFVADHYPPRTLGMVDGKLCMSRDLHEEAITDGVPVIKPEDN